MSGPALRPDLDALRAAVTPRTRLILLNSPHNPTGIVFTRDELAEVARIAIENDLLVLSDEAYEHLWFDDHRHVPIATLPGMWERTVTVGSGGKSFSFTGWKVGWATGPPTSSAPSASCASTCPTCPAGRSSTRWRMGSACPTSTSRTSARTWPPSATCSAAASRPSVCG